MTHLVFLSSELNQLEILIHILHQHFIKTYGKIWRIMEYSLLWVCFRCCLCWAMNEECWSPLSGSGCSRWLSVGETVSTLLRWQSSQQSSPKEHVHSGVSLFCANVASGRSFKDFNFDAYSFKSKRLQQVDHHGSFSMNMAFSW